MVLGKQFKNVYTEGAQCENNSKQQHANKGHKKNEVINLYLAVEDKTH